VTAIKDVLLLAAVGCGLLTVAVGCGRQTAQNGAAPPVLDDTVEVPVAVKDLPVGTKLIKDDLKTYVTYKKVSKDALPAEFASSEEQLADKRLARTIRAGEPFNPQDLATHLPFSPPGFSVLSFGFSPDKVPSSVRPGSKVDVLSTFRLRKQEKLVVVPVLTNMEVLAIDPITVKVPPGAPPLPIRVALAQNNKQVAILHATISRGADLRLILRNTDKPLLNDKVWTEEEIWTLLSDGDTEGGVEGRPAPTPEPTGK